MMKRRNLQQSQQHLSILAAISLWFVQKLVFLTLNMTLTINHIFSDKIPLGEIVQVLCLGVNLI